MKKFINIGFEFTASLKVGKKPNPKRFCVRDTIVCLQWGKKISNIPWIENRYDSDNCGCEVSTPIIKTKQEVISHFNQFKSFAERNAMTLDINKAVCGLGGCHIHLDLSYMNLPFRKRFLRNMGVFFTNNPQLNWGFNDVNDDCNANSLLSEFRCEETTRKVSINNFVYFPHKSEKVKVFLKDTKPLHLFLAHPTHIELYKYFAIRYDPAYKTLEMRIFDMPKNLNQHLLHYDVAMGIYRYIYKLTEEKKKLKLVFTSNKEFKKITVDNAIGMLDTTLTSVGIPKHRTQEMRDNIATRYEWNENFKHYYLR